MLGKYPFIPLTSHIEYSPEEMLRRSEDFYNDLKRRKTVREFSKRLVDKKIIENALLAAGTAPNGANLQPWHFVVVSDPKIKVIIKEAAEKEEHEFYTKRAPDEWKAALAPLGTDEHKPFLTDAPYLIVVMCQSYGLLEDGRKVKNYYVNESVGIATGMLITALHHSGLSTLTHTPSPMGFLNEILGRPDNERPFLVLVVGYPQENVQVPDIKKKKLEEIASFL